jgi:hypothetical protein
MATGLMDLPMAAEKPQRPTTMSVKLHTDVIETARVVAALRGVQMMDMLSDILRPILAKMEGEELTKRVQGTAKRGKGGAK